MISLPADLANKVLLYPYLDGGIFPNEKPVEISRKSAAVRNPFGNPIRPVHDGYAMELGLDYEHHAVLIGYFFYLFHNFPPLAIPFGYASMYRKPWALLGFGLVLCFNGKRGNQHKILNYWFYPMHMPDILRTCLGI